MDAMSILEKGSSPRRPKAKKSGSVFSAPIFPRDFLRVGGQGQLCADAMTKYTFGGRWRGEVVDIFWRGGGWITASLIAWGWGVVDLLNF